MISKFEGNGFYPVNKKMDIIYKVLFTIELLACFAIVVYENINDFKIANTGLVYKKFIVGDSDDIEKDKYLIVERQIKHKNKVVERFNQYGARPFLYLKKSVVRGSFEDNARYFEALELLHKNGSIDLKMKASDLPFEWGVAELEVPKEDEIVVSLKIVDAVGRDDFSKVLEKYNAERKKEVEKIQKKDEEKIEKYLKDNKKIYTKEDMMYVVVEKNDEGEPIRSGDKIKFNFSSGYHDGKLKLTNIEELAKKHKLEQEGMKYEPQEFTIPEEESDGKGDPVLKVLKTLTKGSKGYFYFSSVSIYNINPDENFYEFFLEIVDVEHKKEKEKKDEINEKKEEKNEVNEEKKR